MTPLVRTNLIRSISLTARPAIPTSSSYFRVATLEATATLPAGPWMFFFIFVLFCVDEVMVALTALGEPLDGDFGFAQAG